MHKGINVNKRIGGKKGFSRAVLFMVLQSNFILSSDEPSQGTFQSVCSSAKLGCTLLAGLLCIGCEKHTPGAPSLPTKRQCSFPDPECYFFYCEKPINTCGAKVCLPICCCVKPAQNCTFFREYWGIRCCGLFIVG